MLSDVDCADSVSEGVSVTRIVPLASIGRAIGDRRRCGAATIAAVARLAAGARVVAFGLFALGEALPDKGKCSMFCRFRALWALNYKVIDIYYCDIIR